MQATNYSQSINKEPKTIEKSVKHKRLCFTGSQLITATKLITLKPTARNVDKLVIAFLANNRDVFFCLFGGYSRHLNEINEVEMLSSL